MPDTERLDPETRYERDRGEALNEFLRRFRHEISTPLSGATLHLEVALRRLLKPGGFDLAAVVENLRTCQQSLEAASAMLELIGDVAREEAEEPRTFSLTSSVARAAGPYRSQAEDRGLALELPPEAPAPGWFGSPREVERVVSELTSNAVAHSSPPGSIRWTVEETPSGIELACRSRGRIPDGDPEHLFGVSKRPESPGRGFGLLRARRAARANGGELSLRQEAEEVCAVVRFSARQP